jgi:molecular chaperone GrpE (heat shock protein)
MTEDAFSVRSMKLLQAFDFAAEIAAKEEEHRRQLEGFLLSFLEVLDSLDRVLTCAKEAGPDVVVETASWANSVRLVVKQMEQVFSQVGLMLILCLGERVDPERHEIVDVRDEVDSEDDMIVEVAKRGYEWNGRLLRRPQVVVARKRNMEEQ